MSEVIEEIKEVKPIDPPSEEELNKESVNKFKGSLGRMMDKAKNQETFIDPSQKKQEPSNADKIKDVKNEQSNFDYGVLKNIKDEHLSKIDEYLKNKKINDPEVRYKLAVNQNDILTHQTLSEQRKVELEKLKMASLPTEVKEYDEFIKELQADPVKAFQTYKDKFGLPSLEFVTKQLSSGTDINSKIKEWQDTELTKKIEKKFKIEDGTFVFDASEAYKVGTPSYEFRVETNKKENELSSSYKVEELKEKEIINKIKTQRTSDLSFLKDTYFKSDSFSVDESFQGTEEEKENILAGKAEEAFKAKLKVIDEMVEKASKGDVDSNPYSLKIIFRGINHEELLKRAIEDNTRKINEAYNKKGFFLPKGEYPTDVSSVTPVASSPKSPNRKVNKFSPLSRSISQYS